MIFDVLYKYRVTHYYHYHVYESGCVDGEELCLTRNSTVTETLPWRFGGFYFILDATVKSRMRSGEETRHVHFPTAEKMTGET